MHNQTEANKPVRFLEGQHVYLRPISLEDSELYFRMMFNPEMRRLTGSQKSFTLEQIQQYIESKTKDSSSLLLLIALRDTDEVIGDIQFLSIDSMNRNAYIRIAINGEQHRGKGHGTEAMILMLDYGFGILNLHRVELNVFVYNERAHRVYEKIGFKQEGVQREALYYDHAYHDSIVMGLLEHEFRALHIKKTP